MVRHSRVFRVVTLVLFAAVVCYGVGRRKSVLASQEPSQAPAASAAAPQPSPRRLRLIKRPVSQAPPAAPARTPRRDTASSAEIVSAGVEDVVRVNTDLASVLLTALDKDQRFITTLSRDDIRVYEDGVPQQITQFERETDLPLSLAILIDVSRSQEKTLSLEQEAARTFVKSVINPATDRASVVSFTGYTTIEQELTSKVADINAAIDRAKVVVPPDDENPWDMTEEEMLMGSTSIWDAIWITTNQVLSRTPAQTRRAIILLSDGDDTSSQATREDAADYDVKHNVMVYSIGISDKHSRSNFGAMRKISKKTGGRFFAPPDRPGLLDAFAQIQAELRSQYLVAYSPTNRKRDGAYRQIRIELANPALRKDKMRLLYREGYYARNSGAPQT